MPFYEYRCQACGHEFEEFQKITDAPIRTCPECRRDEVKRLISQTSFVLKGSGWYVTDYGGRKTEKTDKPADKTDKPADKTDKPADKTGKPADKTAKKDSAATRT